MKRTVLLLLFSFLFVWINIVVVTTSLKSNLFEEWNFLASIPWMKATLWDFYINVFTLLCIVAYIERTFLRTIIWTLLFALLGSIGTCMFVLYRLWTWKEENGWSALFEPRKIS